jgi:hypothetical protein
MRRRRAAQAYTDCVWADHAKMGLWFEREKDQDYGQRRNVRIYGLLIKNAERAD